MKGRMHHKGTHHSPKGHHDVVHGHHHMDHELGHTAKAAGHHKGKHHKHVGKVGGKKGKHHAGHMARGGKMTPSSPLSGAQTKPLNFEHDTIPKEDVGGKGADSR